MVWFYAKTKSISFTPSKFVKHFYLHRKHGKPSKQTILAVQLANKILKTGTELDVPRNDSQKTLRSMANIDAIRSAGLKVERGLSVDSGQNKVMGSIPVHSILRKDIKKFLCKIQIKQSINTRQPTTSEDPFLSFDK